MNILLLQANNQSSRKFKYSMKILKTNVYFSHTVYLVMKQMATHRRISKIVVFNCLDQKDRNLLAK